MSPLVSWLLVGGCVFAAIAFAASVVGREFRDDVDGYR